MALLALGLGKKSPMVSKAATTKADTKAASKGDAAPAGRRDDAASSGKSVKFGVNQVRVFEKPESDDDQVDDDEDGDDEDDEDGEDDAGT